MIPAPALPSYTDQGVPTSPLRRALKRLAYSALFLLALALVGGLFLQYLITPPPSFPTETELVIAEGMTTTDIADQLYAAGFIRSPFVLYAILALFHDPRDLKASTYIFSQPLSATDLAARLMLGDYGNDLVRFVHYEGESRELLSERAADVLRDFDRAEFMSITEGLEGKLFPDTYLVPKTFTAQALADVLLETYEARVGPLRAAMAKTNLTEDQIINLASILEREANSPESKAIVAGIFLRRLEIGMPLQADATMEYVIDKPLNELVAADLDRESPYNTYLNPGLPPTPIGNPGLAAIQAVLEPTPSTYLFYLTGNDGEFYYANTYEQHKVNIDRYLR
jgi:UPF0755 protein